MRIGLFLGAGGAPLDALTGQVEAAAEAGLASAYFGQFGEWDAITVAALAGRAAPGVEVGTAVVPTYPRHPLALASQALTAQAATGGRFVLGVGPSHRWYIEDSHGYDYARPARHVREYLTALRPLLHGEAVDYHGETLTAVGQVAPAGVAPPQLVVAALGPVMLRVAGELADGVVTTWTGAAALAGHIVPKVTAAAEAAGRPAPRVLAGTVMALTADPDAARDELAARLGFAGDLPAYRALLDRQGLAGVHETVVAGDEALLEREIARFADAGVTDLLVSPHGGEPARTLEFLGGLVRAGRAAPA
ncbi:TIGR03564 family F420-dependent LLM class oxidoreductase [Actinomadura parmotrematis]|uniref:TIGR03564 family F420-dependent LLM class oxidoreductase n=1 Tax=Actinomadura parmotrematis TaxID=2864039 RepID=A0ABS7FK76_9ACTN|nr:TIGR03564 family F420-dependent LLM class oxidoreductase [Actinomadura parmotrematis]MBW8480770.1 TIGR03564 family F420-dependent LLM class oxidoreductase [Actinomadura parmotrematis]